MTTALKFYYAQKTCTRPVWKLTRPFLTFVMLRKIGYFLPSNPNGGPCARVTSDPAPVLVFLIEMLLRMMIICVMVGLMLLAGWQTFIYCQISLDWNNCHLKSDWLSICFFFFSCCHWICFQQQHPEICEGLKVQIRVHDFFLRPSFVFFVFFLAG